MSGRTTRSVIPEPGARLRLRPSVWFAWLTVLMALVIAYGCLYPFRFHLPPDGHGSVLKLLASWREWHGRGDFLSNILLYLPLGFFAALSFPGRFGPHPRLAWTILGGAALSLTIELTQYYDAGRTTAAVNLYCNALGTALGALAGSFFAGDCRIALLRPIWANPAPTLLLAGWLTCSLFRYPAAESGILPGGELLYFAATWLLAGLLLEAILGRRGWRWGFPVLIGVPLLMRAAFAGGPSRADLLGIAVAFVWLLLYGRARGSLIVTAFLLAAAVLDQAAIQPPLRAVAGQFGWTPFAAYMQGSERDILGFLQRGLVYGGMIWLLAEVGLGLIWSAALVAAGVLLADWVACVLLARSGEISDCVIALLIAVILAPLSSLRAVRAPDADAADRPISC
jgi:VanZ family protein